MVKIRLRPLGQDNYRLIISDNGVGFPKDLNFRKTESLGMQLVTLLVGQLDGTIDLKRKGGTTFDIVFKEQKKKKQVAGKQTFARLDLRAKNRGAADFSSSIEPREK